MLCFCGNDDWHSLVPALLSGSTLAEWKKFARRSSSETIFKYSVTLLDNIDVIVVGNDREKRRLLEVFHKRKISKLPDGRRVEDIVLVR